MPTTSHIETQHPRILCSAFLFERSCFDVTTQNAHIEQYYRLAEVNNKSLNGYQDFNPVSHITILGHTYLEQHVATNQRIFKKLDLSKGLESNLVYCFLYTSSVSPG